MESVTLVWDNFGPMHDDRVGAVAKSLSGSTNVVGLQLFGRSDTYEWDNEDNTSFKKVTIFPGDNFSNTSFLKIFFSIVKFSLKSNTKHIFLCHYEKLGIFTAALILRILRKNVYTMSCSKFDDIPRNITREFLKRLYFIPYHGAISSGIRSRDYMRLMGISPDKIFAEYNTVSITRIQNSAGKPAAPGGLPFADRHFTIVARFVPKKNLSLALEAYAIYCTQATKPRPLHLCGSGDLEAQLRQQVISLGLQDNVVFRGFLQSDEIASSLGDTLALLLPSVEEQFGNVVIEAQAMGVPVILSDNCGARDKLVRSSVNGFIVEPDNAPGFAFFMGLLDSNEELWRRMSTAAKSSAELGDVGRFVEAVKELIGVP